MNVENDFLTDFDLFGKTPELYYKGKSKKSSTFGIILTVIYIILYITFLIYKLVRMVRRVDVTFYDSYTFQGLPSIKLTNNEFYGAFGMGGIVNEQIYYLTVDYISKVRVNGAWVENTTRLETEICQLDWFGPDYRELFKDQPLDKYYCIKNVSGMVLEGYSNLERFSNFNVKFYPCHGQTKDGKPCAGEDIITKFFTINTIELKIQDNDLNPTDYKNPVLRRIVDMNSPIFLNLYQLIFSYLQIVNIETDEDLTGLNFFTDSIRKQVYTRYDESFIIASPLLFGNIVKTGGPVADVTLQLAAKVLTEKRQYVQLIDVLGDVGGLMEILYTFLNIISSFVTEILYDRSLVNNLFSFDLDKKFVVFKSTKNKNKKIIENNSIKDIQKKDSNNLKQKFDDLENNKNIEIFSKENSGEQNIIVPKKKKLRKRKSSKNATIKSSKTTLVPLNEQEIPKEKIENNDMKISSDENKNIMSIYNVPIDPLSTANKKNTTEKQLKNIYINNWLICCFWCTNRKRNVNKILFEEGSRILTERLDILSMFNDFYAVELIQKQLGIEGKGMNMSDIGKNHLQVYMLNNFKSIEN